MHRQESSIVIRKSKLTTVILYHQLCACTGDAMYEGFETPYCCEGVRQQIQKEAVVVQFKDHRMYRILRSIIYNYVAIKFQAS
jgi:hypothetical protein